MNAAYESQAGRGPFRESSRGFAEAGRLSSEPSDSRTGRFPKAIAAAWLFIPWLCLSLDPNDMSLMVWIVISCNIIM